jgi:hypothetical protein
LQNLDFWYKKSETALEPDHKWEKEFFAYQKWP